MPGQIFGRALKNQINAEFRSWLNGVLNVLSIERQDLVAFGDGAEFDQIENIQIRIGGRLGKNKPVFFLIERSKRP